MPSGICSPDITRLDTLDTFDVVVVQLENTQIRKTGDGARGDAADLVVGQVSAIENMSDLKIIHLF